MKKLVGVFYFFKQVLGVFFSETGGYIVARPITYLKKQFWEKKQKEVIQFWESSSSKLEVKKQKEDQLQEELHFDASFSEIGGYIVARAMLEREKGRLLTKSNVSSQILYSSPSQLKCFAPFQSFRFVPLDDFDPTRGFLMRQRD